MNIYKQKILRLTLILVGLVTFLNLAQPVTAADTKTHVFKVYIDPSLVTDMQFAKTVLPKYVQDMNTILAKNTNRELLFDPETGIIPTVIQPHTGSAGVLPTSGFEVWSHVSPTTAEYPYSNGGYMSFDTSGAAALAGLKWQSLYDPDTLTAGTPQMRDYWIQINNMLHEFGHVFGAAIGEYYNLSNIADNTGEAPVQAISLQNPTDPFWSRHTDFHYDPMLANIYDQTRVGSPDSRNQMLSLVKYSNLTAAIMSGDYRQGPTTNHPMIDFDDIDVKLVDRNGTPVSGATVKIWDIRGAQNNPASLITSGLSSEAGTFSFDWGGSPHSNYGFLRLIKAYAPGMPSKAYHLSVFDTDEAAVIRGVEDFELTLQLDGVVPTIVANGNKPIAQNPIIPKRPTFSGVATPGATVEVTVHSDPITCSTVADSSGNWSCTLPSDLEPGNHTVNVTVTYPDSSTATLGPYQVQVSSGGTIIDNNTPLAPNAGVGRVLSIVWRPEYIFLAMSCLTIIGLTVIVLRKR